jgi:hypothetical protein
LGVSFGEGFIHRGLDQELPVLTVTVEEDLRRVGEGLGGLFSSGLDFIFGSSVLSK